MTVAPDPYDRLRSYPTCALCNCRKDAGLIVCWTCYSAHDMRNGILPYAARILANEVHRIEVQEALDAHAYLIKRITARRIDALRMENSK